MLTTIAPAKLNLTMEILGKRDDGYHEIRSIVQTLNLHDKISFQQSLFTRVKANTEKWDYDKSLIAKAITILRNNAEHSVGASIEVDKQIPLIAGLGGDSSDAAAVLRGLNMLWQAKLPLTKLLEIAAQLGSDVPLFLHGGTLLLEGRGEKITPVSLVPHMWVVLLVPAFPPMEEKTKKLYTAIRPENYTNGQITENFISALNKKEGKTVPPLFNVFDSVAPLIFNGLKGHIQKFLEAGATEVHVAGSGPALFTLIQDRSEANQIYSKLQEQKMEAYLTDFS